MFFCMVCKKDFRSRHSLYCHKYKSKQHHEKMKELVYSYKDTIGIGHIDTIRLLETYGIRAYKLVGRKTALHIVEFLFLRDEDDEIIDYWCRTFNNVICFCSYCTEKKYDLCDDYEEDIDEETRQNLILERTQ